MIKKTFLGYFLTLLIVLIPLSSFAKVVDYTLDVDYKEVNFTGKKVKALAINNSIPAPTIKAKVGDILRIKVNNHLKEETSIHWHGVLLPNDQDGVPYVNMPPIKAGTSFTYEYKVIHSGTYWYHSHSGPQEQQGIYGSMIFYPKHETHKYDEEHIVVLSDWTNEHPDQVLANIKKDPDYYALKKDSVQSWDKVLKSGSKAIKLRIDNAAMRMGPMDMSDVGYDAFLINGQIKSILSTAKAGSKIRLRIINAGASSYFNFEFAGSPMKVIATDGVDISPFEAKRIRIAMAETYDVIITVPENKSYEFRATAEDGTGYASTMIGKGKIVEAPTIPKPNLMLMSMMGGHDMSNMNMSGHNMADMLGMDMSKHTTKPTSKVNNDMQGIKMKDHNMSNMNMEASGHKMKKEKHDMSNMAGMGMGKHNMDKMNNSKATVGIPYIEYLSDYKAIKSPNVTTLPKNNPKREVTLELTGVMERYVWSINNKIMAEADNIVIKKGENVKFKLVNKTMMNHPIHVHGHFFRVLNGQGEYSPLKHTVNVAPFETVEIEFLANEEKDWLFHCHNLYHMKLGMGGIIHYEGSPVNNHLNMGTHAAEHGDKWFNATEVNVYSNFTNGLTKFSNNNDELSIEYKHNYKKDYDIDVIYERYMSQFLSIYGGGNFEREESKRINRGIFGIHYVLPFLIEADLRIPTKGKVTLGVGSKLQLTDRTSFGWKWKTDKTYNFSLDYSMTKNLYISTNYDSKERWGLGLSIKF